MFARGDPASGISTDDLPYTQFRAQAISSWDRLSSTTLPTEMRDLYVFWSHFLRQHFNESMHEDFRRCALADMARQPPIRCGARRLASFYSASIAQEQIIPVDVLAGLQEVTLLINAGGGATS